MFYERVRDRKPLPGRQLDPRKKDGIIGYWPFNLSGGDKTRDLSGEGNHGTKGSGVTWVADYLQFDGVDSILVPYTNDLSFGDGSVDVPFTILAEVNVPDFIEEPICDKYQDTNFEWVFGFSTSLFAWVYDDSNSALRGRKVTTPGNFMSVNKWHKLAWTYDGGGLTSSTKIYIDGQQRDDDDFTTGTYVAMEDLSQAANIGASNVGLGGPFTGKMRQLITYKNIVLSDAEVAQHAANPWHEIEPIRIPIGAVAAAAGVEIFRRRIEGY